MDLLSGAIIFVASWIAARRDPYRYPAGKSRLEPLSIIVFACIMGMAAMQLIVEVGTTRRAQPLG
jgi:divalent metal cation (Fe/Co/Zn/Cd) transporter